MKRSERILQNGIQYKSYVVHPCLYKTTIIESNFVFGQMKWRYRINVSDNYQNKSYYTKKDLSLAWYIQIWDQNTNSYHAYENRMYKYLNFYLITTKNGDHTEHIYFTAYIACLYLAYSLMYDKKSSICNCNVCISLDFVHALFGRVGKGSMLF